MQTRSRNVFSVVMALAIALTMFAAVVPVSAQEDCGVGFETYSIRYGDTLSHVARLYGVTLSQIRAVNDIPDVNLIYYGTTLCISQADITTGLVPPPPIGEACEVEPGYTLSGVAYVTGAVLRAIYENNRIANPDIIFAGETILIPPPGTACAS